MPFFSYFPKVRYDIENKQYSDYQIVTHILFRTRIIREILSNTAAYREYYVKDGDTPEILAEKAYNDPEAHWLILYANDIVDPQYDWPLNSRDFIAYIKRKYGSVETAKRTTNHYEKVIERYNSKTQETTTMKYTIPREQLSEFEINAPFDTYDTLAQTQSVKTIELDDATIIETTYRNICSNYEFEHDENEKKKNIKIIKAEYYPQIRRELEILTSAEPEFIRRLV